MIDAIQIQPGDLVEVYDQQDVVDGARGTVLGIKDEWVAVILATSNASVLVHSAKVRRILAENQERGT
jgi:hypothetical protein